MEDDKSIRRYGKKLLESILNDGTASTSQQASLGAAAGYFASRIEGKRLQLGNQDRSRSVAGQDSLAHHQIQLRDKRLIKRRKKISTARHVPIAEMKKKEEEKRKPLSRRQKQKMGLDTIDETLSYELLAPVHQLWLEYIHNLLGFVDENGDLQSNQFQVERLGRGSSSRGGPLEVSLCANAISAFQTSLVKADFCGAPIRVTRALNPSLVGIEGLVAKETESTFVVVTKSQHHRAKKSRKLVKVIPKHSSVFSLQIPLPRGAIPFPSNHTAEAEQQYEVRVPLHGNQLCNNIQTRATKKFKARRTIDL